MYDILLETNEPKNNNNLIVNIILLIIVIIILYFVYNKFIKKNNNNNNNNNNIRKIQKQLINSKDYIDDPIWNFEFNCESEEENCESLSCPDGFIVLRKKNTCCSECVKIEFTDTSNNISNLNTNRIDKLKLFENKFIKNNFKFNLNSMGYKTTDTVFSLIDRLLNFDYINFNVVKFINIFNKPDEYIYIGIILIFFGLLFSFSKTSPKIKVNKIK
jgi:hypothetical protein